MKHALTVLMLVSGCGLGGTPIDEGSAEQAVLIEPTFALTPPTTEELLACMDLPENQPSLQWLKDHLVYTDADCFHSWTIDLAIDCTLYERRVAGTIALGGQTMAGVPRTGFLIRTRAATAALADVGLLVDGTIKPRIDLDVAGEATSVTSCTGVLAGEIHTRLDAVLDSPVLGNYEVAGGLDWNRDAEADLNHLEFSLEAYAEPTGGPPLSGSITGSGIERFKSAEPCPHTGTVTFAAASDLDSAESRMTFVGDGQVIIDMADGRTLGPDSLRICQ